MGRQYTVYLMCNQARGTLYIGVTGNLLRRVWEHRQGAVDGFTKRYGVKQLVWFELYGDILQAIQREKQLKRWQRDWKIRLVERNNPQWRDLWMDIR
ncbi:GIY-YIG nuclease family protein [Endozoicomonas sp.]|uniref:GIY-YIG nuclease family protein n=1 Tax=Endozoicomonas sp. TaxID=1892382 RepID=UPI00383BA81B